VRFDPPILIYVSGFDDSKPSPMPRSIPSVACFLLGGSFFRLEKGCLGGPVPSFPDTSPRIERLPSDGPVLALHFL